jgi:hypothetical protein
MQSKRRWLPGWQREELVRKSLEEGMTRRQAAAALVFLVLFVTASPRASPWARLSPPTGRGSACS